MGRDGKTAIGLGVILTTFLMVWTAICFTACGDETVEKRTDNDIRVSEINIVTCTPEEKEHLIREHILEEDILVEETIR